MEVAEERTLRALGIRQTVQLRKKRIREIAGFGGTGTAAKNRGCGRAQVSAICGEEMFPGGLASIGASSGQRKIFEVQSAQIFVQPLRCYSSWRQRLPCAALECSGESFARNLPAASLRLGVQPVQERCSAFEWAREIYAQVVNAALWEIFNHLPTRLYG